MVQVTFSFHECPRISLATTVPRTPCSPQRISGVGRSRSEVDGELWTEVHESPSGWNPATPVGPHVSRRGESSGLLYSVAPARLGCHGCCGEGGWV